MAVGAQIIDAFLLPLLVVSPDATIIHCNRSTNNHHAPAAMNFCCIMSTTNGPQKLFSAPSTVTIICGDRSAHNQCTPAAMGSEPNKLTNKLKIFTKLFMVPEKVATKVND